MSIQGSEVHHRRHLHLSNLIFSYDFTVLFSSIKRLIFNAIEEKKVISFDDFEEHFLSWNDATDGVSRLVYNKYKICADKLYKQLAVKKILPDNSNNFLYPKLSRSLRVYGEKILDVVSVVSKSFNHGILTTAFDTSSHDMDPNGNHKKFYTGFKQVKIEYEENTSRINRMEIDNLGNSKLRSEIEIKHDLRGNVLNAPHHGVKKFFYHPVSQKVSSVLLEDGRTVKYFYNSFGERALKQVFNANGELTKEIVYIRDDKGNVLMDSVSVLNNAKKFQSTSTFYIYGPRGLVGFIRNNEFHSVFTDHTGSIRLVIKNGEVTAAYDYFPYGEMMRKYVKNQTSEISYLFGGKEYDEETHTYNFHARFYDPTIGRFLQVDPMSQYFSSYKFSANSPISFIDPDGEFALALAIGVGVLVGAYLNGAVENDNWNPLKWNYKSFGTYKSMTLGAVSGGFGVAGASVALPAVAAGVAGGYLMGASGQNEWNPGKWNFKRPAVYRDMFEGVILGQGLLKTITEVHKAGTKLQTFVKGMGNEPLKKFPKLAEIPKFEAAASFISKHSVAVKIIHKSTSLGGSMAWGSYNVYVNIMENNDKSFSPTNVGAFVSGFYSGVEVASRVSGDLVTATKQRKARDVGNFFSATKSSTLIKKATVANADAVGLGYYEGMIENENVNPINWKNNIGTYRSIGLEMWQGRFISCGLYDKYQARRVSVQRNRRSLNAVIRKRAKTVVFNSKGSQTTNIIKKRDVYTFEVPEIRLLELDTPRLNDTAKNVPFSILDLGDNFVNSTNTTSNLLLAYTLMKNPKKHKRSNPTHHTVMLPSSVCGILASEAVYGFIEKMIEILGIPAMTQIIDEINVERMIADVKRKCNESKIETIVKFLMRETLKRNLKEILNEYDEEISADLKHKIRDAAQKTQEKLMVDHDEILNTVQRYT